MYDRSSPWRGTPQTSAALIQAWFVAHNPAAPALGDAIWAEASAAGLNADLVAAQIAEETGWWTSAIANDKRNPAGIGAVDNNAYAGALTFPTPQAGIHAQCAHLLSYVLGAANPWAADDPRYAAMPAGYLGTKTTLGDFGAGVWASDPDYASKLISHANSLLAFAGTQGGAAVSGRDDAATWYPSSNYTPGRNGQSIDFITDHVTEGSFGGALTWLRGAAGGSGNTDSSATYLIRQDGFIAQLVDEGDTPWTNGNLAYNRRAITIEHEGYSGQPFPAAQIAASIQLHARIARRHGWAALSHSEAGHLIGHYEVPDPNNPSLGGGIEHHTGCPGPTFPWDTIVAGVNALLAGQQPPAHQPVGDACRTFPETGFSVCHGFRAFWEENPNGLLDYGLPISTEFATERAGVDYSAYGVPAGQMVVQYFERARFEWHPGTGIRFDVLLGLLGSEDPAIQAYDKAAHADAFTRPA